MENFNSENVEIEANIQKLLNYFVRIRNDSKYKPAKRRKFDRWTKELEIIQKQIKIIDNIVLPKIKDDLSISDRNLVLIALIRPSVRHIFSEIKKEFNSGSDFILPYHMLDSLEKCPDRANTLAWIGDASIKYAISSKIWKIESLTKDLDNRRKTCESNENFSGLCDKWGLFEYRINLDPDDKKIKSEKKIKGTLVESIFGVIYIEKGIDGIYESLHLIHKSLE